MDVGNINDALDNVNAGDSVSKLDIGDVDSGGSDSNDGGVVDVVVGVDTNGGGNRNCGDGD